MHAGFRVPSKVVSDFRFPTSEHATSLILAIDLGKFNRVLCAFDTDTREASFRTVKTPPEILRIEFLRQPVVSVVIEACSPAGWVHDPCEELKLPCLVANTSGAAWQWKNVKRKTDRDDALKLAKLASRGELPTVALPAKAMREWKSLIGLRRRLAGERVRGQNRIRALLVSQGLPAPVGNRAWTAAGLVGLGELAKALPDCSAGDLWRGELTLLLDRHSFLVVRSGRSRRSSTRSQPLTSRRHCWGRSPASERIVAVGSRSGVRKCCGVHSWSARGVCCGTTRGRGRCGSG